MRVYGSSGLAISILAISMAVGLRYLLSGYLNSFLVVVLATILAYVPHELMHIAVARRLGCLSTYTLDPVGLVLTLMSSAFPIKIIMPGYVIISAPYYDSFTRRKIEAITASVGPLTNIAIGLGALLLQLMLTEVLSYYVTLILLLLQVIVQLSAWIAFFNLLPIPPLDGSKIITWSPLTWGAMFTSSIGLMLYLLLF
ncbi:MAG: hypothetical protein N3E36_01760 [Sulfolobales archaeon]|nr:hypothetical protein [Sulfolobales archaeon]MCX8198740.1 hypothetical protein [Sulfolobales archaeon]MDW8169813.1 site-2 protease family protein [Desulfurococcaceae archaeon]